MLRTLYRSFMAPDPEFGAAWLSKPITLKFGNESSDTDTNKISDSDSQVVGFDFVLRELLGTVLVQAVDKLNSEISDRNSKGTDFNLMTQKTLLSALLKDLSACRRFLTWRKNRSDLRRRTITTTKDPRHPSNNSESFTRLQDLHDFWEEFWFLRTRGAGDSTKKSDNVNHFEDVTVADSDSESVMFTPCEAREVLLWTWFVNYQDRVAAMEERSATQLACLLDDSSSSTVLSSVSDSQTDLDAFATNLSEGLSEIEIPAATHDALSTTLGVPVQQPTPNFQPGRSSLIWRIPQPAPVAKPDDQTLQNHNANGITTPAFSAAVCETLTLSNKNDRFESTTSQAKLWDHPVDQDGDVTDSDFEGAARPAHVRVSEKTKSTHLDSVEQQWASFDFSTRLAGNLSQRNQIDFNFARCEAFAVKADVIRQGPHLIGHLTPVIKAVPGSRGQWRKLLGPASLGNQMVLPVLGPQRKSDSEVKLEIPKSKGVDSEQRTFLPDSPFTLGVRCQRTGVILSLSLVNKPTGDRKRKIAGGNLVDDHGPTVAGLLRLGSESTNCTLVTDYDMSLPVPGDGNSNARMIVEGADVILNPDRDQNLNQ